MIKKFVQIGTRKIIPIEFIYFTAEIVHRSRIHSTSPYSRETRTCRNPIKSNPLPLSRRGTRFHRFSRADASQEYTRPRVNYGTTHSIREITLLRRERRPNNIFHADCRDKCSVRELVASDAYPIPRAASINHADRCRS